MDSDYFHQGLIEHVTIILLLLFSSFVSVFKTDFFSLKSSDVSEIKERRKRTDSAIIYLLEHSKDLSVALLITKAFVSMLIIVLGAYAFNRLITINGVPVSGIIVGMVVLAFILLIFEEIIPKAYARRNTLKCVRKSAFIFRGIEWVCRPLSKAGIGMGALINRLLVNKIADFSVVELSKVLERSSAETPEEKEMLSEIIKFRNKTASEIMTPRLDIENIEINSNFRQVISFIVDSGYSRIPVYAETEDDIKGILYIKDLLPYIGKPDTFQWQSLIRTAYFVPETKKIDDLLEEFRKNKIHMTIVVDEYGGTSGIVTMEDILEEIVGEISDEYDEDEKQFIRLPDGSLIFEAKILLNDFFRAIEVDPAEFDDLTDDVDTLAGLLLEIKGDFPKRKEIIDYSGYRFQILEIDSRRILKVKFTHA